MKIITSKEGDKKIGQYIIILLIISLLAIAFTVNSHLSENNITKVSDWIGFWGGVLGNVIGILSSLFILLITLNHDRQKFLDQKIVENKLKDIYELENKIMENILFFSGNTIFEKFNREKLLSDIKNDILILIEINRRKFEIISHSFLNIENTDDKVFIEIVYTKHDELINLINNWDKNLSINYAFNNLKESLFSSYEKISEISYDFIKIKKEKIFV